MKKLARIAMALLLGVIMIFSVACNMEEYNYLHENTDKSNLSVEQFAEWMYNRTKTSIKIARPNKEIVYNVKMLMEDYPTTNDYIDSLEEKAIKDNPKNKHLDVYSLLSPILEEHAKRTTVDEIWVGKTWRDTGRALNMSTNAEVMALIANQIMARGKPVTQYAMYKEIARSEVKEGEEIVEVVYQKKEGEEDPADKVRVKFYDEAQAFEIVKNFIQNAIYYRPTTQLGSLYVLYTMYRFSDFVGYDDAHVFEEEYHPGSGENGENDDGTEIIRTKHALSTYYQQEYMNYVA